MTLSKRTQVVGLIPESSFWFKMKAKEVDRIRAWLDKARQEAKSHLLVVENEYKGIRFPVYVDRKEELPKCIADLSGLNKVRVIEVYSTEHDPEVQINNQQNWLE